MPSGFLSGNMLVIDEHRVSDEQAQLSKGDGLVTAKQPDPARVRRLKLSAAAWGMWTILVTVLGVGSLTLWAVAVGVPALVVGIMGLGVHFVRPGADPAARRVQRLKFHVAAWLFGMAVLTPIWLLIERQDNGGFERWSNNSRPGDWDPWILIVGGVWALSIVALLSVRRVRERPTGAR